MSNKLIEDNLSLFLKVKAICTLNMMNSKIELYNDFDKVFLFAAQPTLL